MSQRIVVVMFSLFISILKDIYKTKKYRLEYYNSNPVFYISYPVK